MFEKKAIILLIVLFLCTGCTQIVIPLERVIPMMLIDASTRMNKIEAFEEVSETENWDRLVFYQDLQNPPYHHYVCAMRINELDHDI